MIHLAFRFDDPSRTSDHALERLVLARFRAAAVPLTAAVVPFECTDETPVPLTADAVPHLIEARKAGVLEVALHGYCHRALARLPDGNSSELAGIEEGRQRAFLTEGRTRLEQVFGVPVRGFVPPWNSYDRTTLDLLAELDFAYLSADWSLVREDALPLPVVPHTCNLAHLEEALAEARRFASLEPAVLVVLHHFDFAESGSGEATMDLDRLADLLALAAGAPDLVCTGMEALATRLHPAQCRRNLRLARRRRGLHWRLQRLLPHYALLGGERIGFGYAVAREALLGLPRAMTP
jgi:peptidoglycan/xylan/chitin deacetylase (PgdA/CDA1 family)